MNLAFEFFFSNLLSTIWHTYRNYILNQGHNEMLHFLLALFVEKWACSTFFFNVFLDMKCWRLPYFLTHSWCHVSLVSIADIQTQAFGFKVWGFPGLAVSPYCHNLGNKSTYCEVITYTTYFEEFPYSDLKPCFSLHPFWTYPAHDLSNKFWVWISLYSHL